ncbi:methyltransferase domain-containing protein [Paraburkholderia gardini]|uniref:Methyltransferase family protein n=1 Tax=Paraburkholderia gardini TaxID=2823469 RepID=A0ABM8TXA0_9BURK|nr:methyltransferase domain-containing protein [Paraburkholderia gardini]CAG4885543.1 hypothetical protein R54767_00032 [Paraburkholderia gardini]
MKLPSIKSVVRSLGTKRQRIFKAIESDLLGRIDDVGQSVVAIGDQSRTIDTHVRVVEDRSTILESLLRVVEERSRTLESLMRVVEERSNTLESLILDVNELTRIVEARSRTIEYDGQLAVQATNYQISQLQRLYIEAMPSILNLEKRPAFNASEVVELKTDYPIAMDSSDHIMPDSTMEGVARPTFFVQNCISLLGPDIKFLDLGTGAAGIVFEFAMNDIFAVGVDGSDFCRQNRIGYWPLLQNNLFTCDITKPFDFKVRHTAESCKFDVVTMWEVLEHIDESDFPGLFENISGHLKSDGYFIGSVSLVEYVAKDGQPYHVTLKPRDWWKEKFLENGLVILEQHPFNENWFCRGTGPRFQDFHNYATNPEDGFLFVARRATA